VTVYERKRGGPLWARIWDPNLNGSGGWRRRSLGHRDQDRAKSYADNQLLKLRKGAADISRGNITLADVFAVYERHRTPHKKPGSQKGDRRHMELWKRFLGCDKDPHVIAFADWEAFMKVRSSGYIDSRGNPVADPEKQRKVRTRVVQKDLAFLNDVLTWAAGDRQKKVKVPSPKRDGRSLIRENPVRNFPIPSETNPLRPVASQDRLEALREAAAHLRVRQRHDNRVVHGPTYLLEILDIVAGTARRISAVLQLRYDDLVLARTKDEPHGAIRWRADADKMGYESTVAISPDVRAAVDRILMDRPGIGAAPLFPSPPDPRVPIRKDVVDKWLLKAERAARLEHLTGGLWHPYRRKWATERKHLPTPDVANAGGWRSLQALQACYQAADKQTTLAVVLGGGELREARG
jgi:integrase